MSTPPPLQPLLRDQRKVDADHLKLLAVFHYVLGAFAVLALGFLLMHWLLMSTMIVASGVGNIVSGLCIRARRGRIFSLIVAGINCLCFPFGTVLGVFTFVVLLRESVVEVYEATGRREK